MASLDTGVSAEGSAPANEEAVAIRPAQSGKSSVLMEVKPWDDETDMKKLEEAVRAVQMEGLLWGASKLVPVGYGMNKMTIMLTIDDSVSVDSLIEDYLTAEPINEICGPVGVAGMKQGGNFV